MSKIATTTDKTVWQCDNCEKLSQSPNAFTRPTGWWEATVQRTNTSGRHYEGSVQVCGKQCFLDVILYRNSEYIDEVEQ